MTIFHRTLLGMLVVGLATVGGRADDGALMTEVLARWGGALAMVRATVTDEVGERAVAAPAVCVEASGIFMTTAFDRGTAAKAVTDCRLILPGVEGESVAATLLGVDPLTGLALLKTDDHRQWPAVDFDDAAAPAVGGRVVSVGLMTGRAGYPPYLGTGYVSAVLRTPGRLAYVTGGRLTGLGSPVFDSRGRAVGLVTGQAMVPYRLQAEGAEADVDLASDFETCFFLPAAEFAHVLAARNRPAMSGRLPWLGVNTFEASRQTDDTMGVAVKGVFPNQPAAKAGMKDGDIIVALDGRPVERLATDLLTTRNFIRELMRHPAGSEVVLTVRHDGTTQEVRVTPAPMPTLPSEAKRFFHPDLGVIFRERVALDQYTDNPPPADHGMIVVGTASDSLAARAGLAVGDVVIGIGGRTADTADEVQQLLAKAIEAGAKEVELLITRAGATQRIALPLSAEGP